MLLPVASSLWLAGTGGAGASTARTGSHYQLNGSAIEARGLGEGILAGFPQEPFVAGKMGPRALAIDAGQHVALPTFYRGTQFDGLGVSAWLKTNSSDEQVIVSFGRDDYWELGIARGSAGAGRVSFELATDSGLVALASASRIDDGIWHHVAVSFDGRAGKLRIFLDGSLDAERETPGGALFGSGQKRFGFIGTSSAAAVMNGAHAQGDHYAGVIDDLRIAGAGLTLAQVEEIVAEDPSTAADGARSLVDGDGDGMPNQWEEANGLDPRDPTDADANTDGDLGTNIQEFRARTNPRLAGDYTPPPAKPLVEVVAVREEAYEKEGTAAIFRISVDGNIGNGMPVFFSLGTSADPGEGAAEPSDYVVTDRDGNPLNGFVVLTGGGASAEILILPTQDTRAEVPEVVELSLEAHADYDLAERSSARCRINDGTDTPANAVTFKALYAPERGASTGATGFATLTVNGPRTEATFYTTFRGLSSPQSAAHIHHVAESAPGVPDFTVGGPVVEPLPLGADYTHVWRIGEAGGFRAQEVLDALFRQNGLSLYCNVHTANFGGGEIWGFFEEFSGATELSPGEVAAYESPAPIPALTEPELKREVSRFLTQTTWGPTMAEIEALYQEIVDHHANGDGTYDQVAAFRDWIDGQYALDQTRLFDLVWANDEYEFHGHRLYTPDSSDAEGPTTRLNPVTGALPNALNFEGSMWTLFSYSHDQLRQRVAFAMSQVWVISRLEGIVNSRHYGAAQYWDDLADDADGRFRPMLERISRSPMMGQYLSHLKNEKAVLDNQGNVLVAPDENYAREIQQLFSIGLLHLLKDGRVRLNGSGQPTQTYSNDDIENLARVFTGWSFREYYTGAGQVVNNNNFYRGNGIRYVPQLQWRSGMKNFAAYHDQGSKRVLGSTIPAGLGGGADLDAALDIIANHPNVAPFLSTLLIKRLTHSNPSPAYVYRVANVFEGGSNHHSGAARVDAAGVRGDLGKVVRAILLDSEVRSLGNADHRIDFGKPKEPALVVTHAIRALNAQSKIPLEMLTRLASGPNLVVQDGSGNTIALPVTGHDPDWPPVDYAADQFDNFPPGTSLLRITQRTPLFGQSPLSAPSVFNWFLPDYSPGGQISVAGLTAPELQLATATLVVHRINFTDDLLRTTNGVNGNNHPGFANTDDYIVADRSEYEEVYRNAPGGAAEKAEALVDYLDLVFAAGALKQDYGASSDPENPRQCIITAVNETTESVTQKVINALYLVMHSPTALTQR